MTWRDWFFTPPLVSPEQREQLRRDELKRCRMQCSVWHAEDIDGDLLVEVVYAETWQAARDWRSCWDGKELVWN